MGFKAVFLDRDGVLVQLRYRDGHLVAPQSVNDFELIPNIKNQIERLIQADYRVLIATNQPDISRGKMKPETLATMHQALLEVVGRDNILEIYVCPHDDADQCICRKPRSGMLLQAAKKWQLDLAQSWMVGDQARDIEAGRAAGCQTILISPKKLLQEKDLQADYTAHDLTQAVDSILGQ